MSRDPIFNVQQALYERLTIGANKIKFDVYDDIPEDTAPDFVEIQPVSTVNNDAKRCPHKICVFLINCWTTDGSNQRVSEMFNAVSQSLTFSSDFTPNPLSITNFNTVQMILGDTQINNIQDVSEFKRQGVMEIEIWVEEIE